LLQASGYTPFLIAVEFGRNEIASLLLKHGAGLKAHNKLQHNALEIADWYGHKTLVEKLMKLYNSGTGDESKDGSAPDRDAAAASSTAETTTAATPAGGADPTQVTPAGGADPTQVDTPMADDTEKPRMPAS